MATGTTASTPRPTPERPSPVGGPDPAAARAVWVWAAVGAGCLALTAYEWVSWLLKGHAHASPGGTPMPSWMRISLWCWQAAFLVGAVGVVYWCIVRPLRRERRLPFDGMFAIGWFIAWAMQDSWFNYGQQWFNYNSHLLNLGCPQCEVPGWSTPRGAFQAEPFFVACLYVFALFLGCVVCNTVMRRAKRRWPGIGPWRLVAIAWATMALVDGVAEIAWAHTGTYSYVAAKPSMSLWGGRWYQYPFFMMILWGLPWALIACTRYFRNDRGESLAERGATRLHGSQRRVTGIRLLAVIGLLNAIFFVFSNLPNQLTFLHADRFPRDVLTKTYFTNSMCGSGTPLTCPAWNSNASPPGAH